MSKAIERAPERPQLTPARLGRFLWGAIWTPFWLGSTLPPPAWPDRRAATLAADERTPLILRQIDGLRETIWRQRRAILGFRGLWLALLAVDLWLGLRTLAGRDLSPRPFLLVALAVVAFAAFLIVIARPSRGQMARTLDRSFGLRERLTTAVEEAEAGRPTGLRALQILDATRITRHIATATAFRPHLPAREIAAALATGICCLVLLVMLLMQHLGVPGAGAGANTGIGAGAGAGNAPSSQAGDRAGQQAGQNDQAGQNGQQGAGQPGGQPTAQGKEDLNTVAGVFQDHPSTSAAGDKLAAGDYAGAAGALREAGDNAAQTAPQERQAVANDVQNAADRVSDPQLARDLRDVANGLTRPNAAGAQEAFDRVANDVERTAQGDQPGAEGQQGQPGQQGQNGQRGSDGGAGAGTGSDGNGVSPQLPSGQRQSPPASSAPLLGADGRPIELPKGEPGDQTITTREQQGRTNGAVDPGAAGASGGAVQQGTVGEAGVDTNQVPYDQRVAVERYFTPNSDDGR